MQEHRRDDVRFLPSPCRHGRHRQTVQRQVSDGPCLVQRPAVVLEQACSVFRRRYVLRATHVHYPVPSLVPQLEPALVGTGIPLEERDVMTVGLRQERHYFVVLSSEGSGLPALLLEGLRDVIEAPPRLPLPNHHDPPILLAESLSPISYEHQF